MGVIDIVLLFVGQDMVNHRGSDKISWLLPRNIAYSSIILFLAVLQKYYFHLSKFL